MSEEYERWEARYSAPDYVFGKKPNYFIAEMQAPAADVRPSIGGCRQGEGRNSVWLAQQGTDVHAIDFSPTALDKAHVLARQSVA